MIRMRQVYAEQAHRLGMQMGSSLRRGDLMECNAAGFTGYEAIVRSLDASTAAFGAFEHGSPLALWGVCAHTLLGDVGQLWFLTTHGVEHHRKLLLMASRVFVRQAEGLYPRLEAVVHKDYTVCIRWLEWLGFSVAEPMPGALGAFYLAKKGF